MKNRILAKLFGNSERSIANWRIEKRPIIDLIEKYFTEGQIVEFLNNGTIDIDNKLLPRCDADNEIEDRLKRLEDVVFEKLTKGV